MKIIDPNKLKSGDAINTAARQWLELLMANIQYKINHKNKEKHDRSKLK